MPTVLKDVLIAAGEIDKYFESAPVHLWRAHRTRERGALFGLVEADSVLSNGRLRSADITIEFVNGVKWVRCGPAPRGLSTFDAPKTFSGTSWDYYKIPKGTVLPLGLAIVKDKYNSRLGATHYTIAPAWDMRLNDFKKLLNRLASAIKRDVG
jgi:hypothetical protein